MSNELGTDSSLGRRSMLRTSIKAVAAAMLPTALSAKPTDHDFTFVVANDLHYRDRRCGEWLERVVASIRALNPRPAFVVLNGDLSEDGTKEQLGAVHEIFRVLPMPVKTTIGNHDYTADGRREHYEELYGKRLNYGFTFREWQFLALDSTDGRAVYRTWVPGATLGWLDANLPGVSHDRPLVVLTHFPLGRNWLRPLNSKDINLRIANHNVQGVLGGHWHGWTERTERGMKLSTGRSCSWWRENHDGSDLKGYFICRAGAGGLSHGFVAVS